MASSGKKRGYTPPSGAQLVLKRSAQECGLDDRSLRSHFTSPPLFPDFQWHSNGSIWKLVEKDQEEGSTDDIKDGSTGTASNNNNPDPRPETGASSLLPVRVGSSTACTTTPLMGTTSQQQQHQEQPLTITRRPASTVYLIQKGREMHLRMQTSPQYLRNGGNVDDLRHQPHRSQNPSKNTVKTQCQTLLEYYYGRKVASSEGGRQWLSQYLPEELLGPSPPSAASPSSASIPPLHGNLSSPPATKNLKRASLDEWEAREAQRQRRRTTTTSRNADHATDAWDSQEQEEEDEAEDYTTNYYESEGEESGGSGGDLEPTF